MSPPSLVEVFRDRWIVVVDKPCGLAAQPARDPALASVQGLLARVHPYVALHHRLDTPASGLMVLALHPRANAGLARAFAEHLARRDYLARALGDPGPEGRWDAPLDGRPARTRWRRLALSEGSSLLEVSLDTGRTHQIRRHAAAAGHPLLGDRRHGGAAGGLWPRLALHAARLRLDHPVTGAPLDLRAPLPEDLRGLMSEG